MSVDVRGLTQIRSIRANRVANDVAIVCRTARTFSKRLKYAPRIGSWSQFSSDRLRTKLPLTR